MASRMDSDDGSDLHQQKVEIEVLNGMYDDDMTISKVDTAYKIMIKIEYPSVRIVLDVTKESTTTAPPNYVHEIEYFPPVSVHIRYPPNYPSTDPPEFNLSSRWLDPLYLDNVAAKLHEMFVPGCTVVYDWLCFLQDNLVELYAESQQTFASTMNQSPQSDAATQHPLQIFVRSSSIMTDIEEYNEFENHKEFLHGKHGCTLCLCELPGSAFPEVKLDCRHIFCAECLSSHVKVRMQTGGVGKMSCPEVGCDTNLPDHVIRCVLSEGDITKYEKLLEEHRWDAIPGMVFCPRPKCNSRVVSNPQEKLAVCATCQYPFCKTCRQLWHGDTAVCPATISLTSNDSEEPDNNDDAAKAPMSLERQQELMSIAWVRSNDNVKSCPSCGWIIQKFGGCNKMTCAKCYKYFCWLCGNIIAGYSHFHTKSSMGCVLFTEADYQPPKETDNVDLPEIDLEELLEPPCPRCATKQEKKASLNMMTCRKCGFKFCYRCKEACFGRWHFSDYGCPLHSKIKEDVDYFKSLTTPPDNNDT